MSPAPLRLAVAGKGGAGKSVLAGTIARLLARRGQPVLALDSDLVPGLAFSLGARQPDEPPLLAAAERGENGRWRLRRGIGPARAVARYSTAAPDGVRLLQCGKLTDEGLPAIQGAVNAFYAVVQRLGGAPRFRDWALVGDLPAGPRQIAYDWAPYAETLLVVVEPSSQSALTARRIARIARARGGVTVLPVGNKIGSEAEARRAAELLGEPLVATIPADQAVAGAERRGVALVDVAADEPAARAIMALVNRLERGR